MAINIKTAVELKKAEKWAISRLDEIENAYAPHFKIALENYMNYNSKTFKRFYKGRADVFVPLSFQIVEVILARYMNAIYQQKMPFPMQGIGEFNKMNEEKLQALFHIQQKQNVKMYLKHLDYFRGMFIYGRGYGKMKWRSQYRKVTRLVNEPIEQIEGAFPVPKMMRTRGKQEIILKYDCWDFTPVDYFDMLVDPEAENGDIQRASFVSEKRMISWDELNRIGTQVDGEGKPIYQNFADLEGKGDAELTSEDLDRKLSMHINISAINNMRQDGKKHRIDEIWCEYDIDGDGMAEEGVLLTLLDKKRIIRAELNPLWHNEYPYISSNTFRRPNEFMGQGLLDATRKIQYEINDKRNQALDFGTMSLNASWIIGDGAGIEDSQIRASQFGVLRVRDMNQIAPMKFPVELIQVAEQANAIMEANMRETTGATRSVQGLQSGGPRQTASQFSQLLAQAGERGRLGLDSYAEEAHTEIGRQGMALNQQFLRRDVYIRLTKEEQGYFKLFGEGQNITRADLVMGTEFIKPNFSDQEGEALRNQNLTAFLQIIQTLPDSPANRIILQKVIHKIWTKQMKFEEDELFDEEGNILDFALKEAEGGIQGDNTPQDEGGPIQPGAPAFDPNAFANEFGQLA